MSSNVLTVLIADDDQAVLDALQFTLQLDGFRVRVYRQGADLLADRDLANAGCVVLDDGIPLMGGFQIIDRMKLLKIQVPVILLTDHATVALRRRAAHAGVTCVLEKPLMENTLLDAILAIPAT